MFSYTNLLHISMLLKFIKTFNCIRIHIHTLQRKLCTEIDAKVSRILCKKICFLFYARYNWYLKFSNTFIFDVYNIYSLENKIMTLVLKTKKVVNIQVDMQLNNNHKIRNEIIIESLKHVHFT